MSFKCTLSHSEIEEFCDKSFTAAFSLKRHVQLMKRRVNRITFVHWQLSDQCSVDHHQYSHTTIVLVSTSKRGSNSTTLKITIISKVKKAKSATSSMIWEWADSNVFNSMLLASSTSTSSWLDSTLFFQNHQSFDFIIEERADLNAIDTMLFTALASTLSWLDSMPVLQDHQNSDSMSEAWDDFNAIDMMLFAQSSSTFSWLDFTSITQDHQSFDSMIEAWSDLNVSDTTLLTSLISTLSRLNFMSIYQSNQNLDDMNVALSVWEVSHSKNDLALETIVSQEISRYEIKQSKFTSNQQKKIDWRTDVAKKKFDRKYAFKLDEWGVKQKHRDTCVLLSKDWKFSSSMNLMILFSYDNYSHFDSSRAKYAHANHATTLARVAAWFADAEWSRSEMQVDRYFDCDHYKSMNASHLCHHKHCIVHVIYEATHMNQERNECCDFARFLRQVERSVSEHCTRHNSSCMMQVSLISSTILNLHWSLTACRVDHFEDAFNSVSRIVFDVQFDSIWFCTTIAKISLFHLRVTTLFHISRYSSESRRFDVSSIITAKSCWSVKSKMQTLRSHSSANFRRHCCIVNTYSSSASESR